MPVDRLTRAAALVFGMPLASLLAAAWLGQQAGAWLALPAEVIAAVSGLTGLGIALVLGIRAGAALLATAELAVHREGMN